MRLLIQFDSWNGLLFAEGAPVGAVMEALNGAQLVRSEGYGKDQRFVPHETTIDVKVLAPNYVGLPDAPEGDSTWVAAYKEKAAEAAALQMKLYQAEAKLKKLQPEVPAEAPKTNDIPF